MGIGGSKSKDPAVGALKRLILKVNEDKEWKGELPKFGKKAAKVAKKVEVLDLSGCQLGPVVGATLGAALPVFHVLKTLVVKDTKLGTIGVKALCKAIAELVKCSITKLCLAGNYDEAMKLPETTEAIAEAIKSAALKGLTELDLSDNGIGPKGGIKLAAVLEEAKPALAELLLADCQLSTTGGSVIGKACALIPTLKHIDLFSCNIGDMGVASIAEFMTSCPLTSISLQANAISWEGAMEFAKGMLFTAAHLESLDISGNAFGNECNDGINAIADSLQRSPPVKLTVFNFAENSLGDGDPTSLLTNFGKLKALEWLDLSSNRFRGNIGGILATSLADLVEMRIVSINDNELMGDEGVVPILEAAVKLGKLKELHAGKTSLSSAGAQAAVKLLKQNAVLTKLDLRGNEGLSSNVDELKSAAGGASRVLLTEDDTDKVRVGPLDARARYYEYLGSKRFIPTA